MTATKREAKPKQQHWVPHLYLKQFATRESIGTDDPKVWVWDKAGNRQRGGVSRVKTLCKQQYLYTPKLIDGSRDWSMEENDLGVMESLAGEVWPLLLTVDTALTHESIRRFIARFVAQLHIRNVWLYEKNYQIAVLARSLYGIPDPRPGSSVDVTDVENFATGVFVDSIRRVDNIAARLLKKRWAILRFPDRVLATCDRPVLFHGQAPQGRPPSLFDKTIYVPLSADRLLYMDNMIDHPANVVCDAPPTTASVVNTLTEQSALRIVAGPRPWAELPILKSPIAKDSSPGARP